MSAAAAAIVVGALLIVSILLGVSILSAQKFLRSHLFKCGYNVTANIDKICTEKIVTAEQFKNIKRKCMDDNLPKFPKTLHDMIKPCLDTLENYVEPCAEKIRNEFKECIKKEAKKYLRKAYKEYQQNQNQTIDACHDVNHCFDKMAKTLTDINAPIKTAPNAG